MIDKIALTRDSVETEELTLDTNNLNFDITLLKSKNLTEITTELIKYDKLIKKIPKTRANINKIKDIKDSIIHFLIDEIKPPYFLRLKDVNYRAIVSHYLFKFTNKSRLIIKLEELNISHLTEDKQEKLKKIFCNKNDSIVIRTNIENIFHLMDFTKIKKSHEYLGDILYERLKIHDTRHVKDIESFESKIASLPWLIDTLKYPDMIFDNTADISKNINPDLIFVRNTGDGSNKEPYMHHYVGLSIPKDKNGNIVNHGVYTILTQFGTKKHTSSKISYLFKKVKINEEIYKRKGVAF